MTRRRLAAPLALLLVSALLAAGSAAAAPPAADGDVDVLREQVAQVRGLSFKSAPPVASVSRDALASRLSRPLDDQRAIRESLTTQMLLEVLGASTPGFDLRKLQGDLLTGQLIAIYDHGDRTLYTVPDGVVGATGRLTLAHELAHALQDQSFDLGRILPDVPENGDAELAAQALVEGDAMLTMRAWGRQYLRPDEKRALGNDSSSSDPILDGAPPLVRGELTFPYEAGWSFVQALYQQGGFDAVNRAFLDPPRSTEQILHPEKYAAGQRPVAVTIPPLDSWLRGSWRTLRTGVFGELDVRLLLEPQLGYPAAEAATTGWGGDAYTILEDDDGRRIVALVTTWDTEGDAAEFYNAYVSTIPIRYGTGQQRTINEPSRVRWTVPGYQVQVLNTENRVRVVYAPDDATLEAVDALLT